MDSLHGKPIFFEGVQAFVHGKRVYVLQRTSRFKRSLNLFGSMILGLGRLSYP
jgi:hypothetical protein